MTDTNRPVAYAVYDNKRERIVEQYATAREATLHCEALEPGERWTGYRYTVRPLRSTEAATLTGEIGDR